jgi:two-component system, OmpR family, sensor histidine kinase KdpD
MTNELLEIEFPRRGRYLCAALTVAVCALAGWAIRGVGFAEANVVMVFLLGVVFVAARYGRGPGILASIASVVVLDFVFVPSYMSFQVEDVQHLFTVAVMLVIALVISRLTSRIRDHAEAAERREQRIEALYSLSRELATQTGSENLARAAAQQALATFGGSAAIYVPDGANETKALSRVGADGDPHEDDLDAVRWVLAHGRAAGAGTENRPNARDYYLPLVGAGGVVGVLAVHPRQTDSLHEDDQRQLLDTFTHQIAGALDRDRLARQVQAAQVEAETERLRSSLLSSVSHDLRTPLAVIAGASSSLLAADAGLDLDTRRELCQTIFDDSQRLARLVDNLLDMTRIESGSMTVDKQLHVLEEIVGSVLHRLRGALAEHVVTTRLPADLPLVPLDDALIEQVLVNLLENARKYVPAGAAVEISAWAEDSHVTVEVADRGPGLAPGEEQHVFEKFYRGRTSAAGRRGAGLGLAICRAIVAAHGGRIWAENRPEGGASFRFTVPLPGKSAPDRDFIKNV